MKKSNIKNSTLKGKNKTLGKKKSIKENLSKINNKLYFQAKTYFLTYKGISDANEVITKDSLAEFLTKENSNDRSVFPEKYLVCEETYESGENHFHVILIYSKRKQIRDVQHYDFLGVHPNIQTMRNMKAALDYVYKEDKQPKTNINIEQEINIALAQNSNTIFEFLYEQMIKDPINFDAYKFCELNNLTKYIYKANYSKAIKLLKEAQRVRANSTLSEKPGFRLITRTLIQETLTEDELKTYDSWNGYDTIVKYLNTMILQRGNRQQKSMNLLITGAPSTGKSALVYQRNPIPGRISIANFCSVYPMGMKDWFPEYRSDVYHCIYWNEAKLTSYNEDLILQLLDGSPVSLPAKGSSHKKVDNPLVIMTSNLTLDQLIKSKYGHNTYRLRIAQANLAVRIENVIIPPGYNLFLLQKLLIS